MTSIFFTSYMQSIQKIKMDRLNGVKDWSGMSCITALHIRTHSTSPDTLFVRYSQSDLPTGRFFHVRGSSRIRTPREEFPLRKRAGGTFLGNSKERHRRDVHRRERSDAAVRIPHGAPPAIRGIADKKCVRIWALMQVNAHFFKKISILSKSLLGQKVCLGFNVSAVQAQ